MIFCKLAVFFAESAKFSVRFALTFRFVTSNFEVLSSVRFALFLNVKSPVFTILAFFSSIFSPIRLPVSVVVPPSKINFPIFAVPPFCCKVRFATLFAVIVCAVSVAVSLNLIESKPFFSSIFFASRFALPLKSTLAVIDSSAVATTLESLAVIFPLKFALGVCVLSLDSSKPSVILLPPCAFISKFLSPKMPIFRLESTPLTSTFALPFVPVSFESLSSAKMPSLTLLNVIFGAIISLLPHS